MVKVVDAAYWPSLVVTPEDEALVVLKEMRDRGVAVVPVLEDGKMRGLLAVRRDCPENARVRDLMNHNYRSLPAERDLEKALLEADFSAGLEGGPVAVLGEDGTFYGFLDAFAALQKLSSVMREMAEQIEELESIFNSIYDGIYVVDNRGTLLRLNKAFEKLTGLKIEEEIGQNLYNIVREGKKIIRNAAAIEVLETGRPVTTLQKFVKTGKEVMISANPVFDKQGRLFRVVANLRDVTELRRLQEELQQSRELNAQYLSELEELRADHSLSKYLVFKSQKMKNIVDLVHRVARADAPVLLLGESGTGKEVIASMLHDLNPRRRGYSLVRVNCGAIPKELMESEFFGYEPGAFTGASSSGKPGLFELANRGTIFLDEIGELPLDLQVKLLRVLQEKEVTRLGGTKTIKVDVRVVAASNRDLGKMVAEGMFREDLFYRINVIPIEIPPLRERKSDIAPLIFHYLQFFGQKYGVKKSISNLAVEHLVNYSWPGNVRELINLIERLVVTTREQEITVEDLPFEYRDEGIGKLQQLEKIGLARALDELERCLVAQAIDTYRNTYKAAAALGVSQSTVVRLMKKHGLKLPGKKRG